MKNLLIIIVIAIAAFNPLFAQNFVADTSTCYHDEMYDSTIIWDKVSRTINTYDADGNITSVREQYWHWDGTWLWRDTSVSTFVYDANGKVITETVKEGEYFVSKRTNTYDTNGNKTGDVGLAWPWYTTNWINEDRNIYVYDANGNQINWINQNWDSAAWENYQQHIYTYDANGRMDTSIFQTWDDILSSWENYTQTIYAYDTNGNKTSVVTQHWNGTAFRNSGRTLYTYDANGNLIGIQEQYWDGSFDWKYNSGSSYTYDANGNMTSASYSTNGPTRKINYFYDANGTLTSIVGQRYRQCCWWEDSDKCEYSNISISNGNCSGDFNLYPDTIPYNYLAVNMASGAAPLTYLWSWGDDSYDTTAYPSHTYDTAGFYPICLTITDASGCKDTYCDFFRLYKSAFPMIHVTVIPQTTVGINNDYQKPFSFLLVSPNPLTSTATLEYTLTQPETITIRLLDLQGKTVKTILSNTPRESGAHQQTVTLPATLPAGSYLIMIESEKGKMGVKITKV